MCAYKIKFPLNDSQLQVTSNKDTANSYTLFYVWCWKSCVIIFPFNLQNNLKLQKKNYKKKVILIEST